MTKSEWKARFVDFLNERNAYSNYITAIRTHAISYKDANDFFTQWAANDGYSERSLVALPFTWSATGDQNYWANLNSIWKARCLLAPEKKESQQMTKGILLEQFLKKQNVWEPYIDGLKGHTGYFDACTFHGLIDHFTSKPREWKEAINYAFVWSSQSGGRTLWVRIDKEWKKEFNLFEKNPDRQIKHVITEKVVEIPDDFNQFGQAKIML